MTKNILFSIIIILSISVYPVEGQRFDANIFGDVKSGSTEEHIPFANVYVEGINIGTVTDEAGHYMLIDLQEGTHIIVASSLGYSTVKKSITIVKNKTQEVNFVLEEKIMSMNEVVVTGTKTFKRRTESPVIVNVLDGKTLDLIQANTLKEGLCFQPGLRIETDCQTCNYSQLRMNGLGGSYSQILINSRPVFSPLTGLYGLEQIPSNMIDRIEVVRGGSSVLYGSSAIGGTVNVITKIPVQNAYEVSIDHSIIGGSANDNSINANLTVLSREHNAGMSFFASNRARENYDANEDNFSEMPALKNNSFGLNSFFRPTANQKLELNLTSVYEYRYGGEMFDKAAYLAQQSEERTHNVLTGGVDYEINFNNYKSAFIAYLAAQNTRRKHYTGIIPDAGDSAAYLAHFINPPYGNSHASTYQAGIQLNHKVDNFLSGTNQFTIGSEYLIDYVRDEIQSYNYLLNQEIRSIGVFIQSDWQITKRMELLSGVRADKHSLVKNVIIDPRFSLLYKFWKSMQLRLSWSTGFRAPQAFDADMHMAFAGGGVSRIRLAQGLKEEKSNSYSVSVNYDKASENYIYGFTIESFYTILNNAFALEHVGEDSFGLIYEKQNAQNSVVKGFIFELRANYNRKVQLESGFTLQSSYYNSPVSYSDALEPMKKYLRTPDNYGYYTLTFTPGDRLNISLSGIYTGPMEVLHLAGAPENPDVDKLITSPSFLENSINISYLFKLKSLKNGVELFGGVKNMFNAYQDDFDTGKNRDSNYIYGPSMPRTFYFGLLIKSL
jgi:outer membrane receptor for ferrienterochelin and colicins